MNSEINTIGILQEKSLHRYIKDYLCPDKSKQEIRIQQYYADIVDGNHIYEVQTQQFNNLRQKLAVFLLDHEVTIVYPIAYQKVIHLADANGEIVSVRKSPKKGQTIEVCKELYRIKEFLKNPNLQLKILLLHIDEYRLQNNKKYGQKYHKVDQIPYQVIEVIDFKPISTISRLLDIDMPIFGVREVQQHLKINPRLAGLFVHLLRDLEVITSVGKEKRRYLYQYNKKDSNDK